MPPATGEAVGLDAEINAVARRLAESIASVLDALPGAARRPQELARRLGLDKVLTSRLLKALRQHDPLACLHLLPGPEPLRRFVEAAARATSPSELHESTRRAIDAFDSLIRREAGDRATFDSMLSAWLPESRAGIELRHKQAAFRAMSHLIGKCVETHLGAVLMYPSADGEHVDSVFLQALLGLRRMRPDAVIKLAMRSIDVTPPVMTTLDGRPAHSIEDIRQDEFCYQPPAQIDKHKIGEATRYTLGGRGFGPRALVDFVCAYRMSGVLKRYRKPGSAAVEREYTFNGVRTPARTLLYDIFVHESVYPDVPPSLSIYDTVFDGVASVNDPTRDLDRLPLTETIQPLGWGVDRCRAADVPRYVELVRHLCEQVGWDGRQFRGYRCRIDYPVYGSQVVVSFAPPARPE